MLSWNGTGGVYCNAVVVAALWCYEANVLMLLCLYTLLLFFLPSAQAHSFLGIGYEVVRFAFFLPITHCGNKTILLWFVNYIFARVDQKPNTKWLQ